MVTTLRRDGVPVAAIFFVVWMVRLVTAGAVPVEVICGAPKLQEAPTGRPEQDSVATPLNPYTGARLTNVAADPPSVTVRFGLATLTA